MVTWRPMERAPQDGRWIIAINRYEPDQRAVIRWDPERFGDAQPWHVSTCDQGYPSDTYTDWIPFPSFPAAQG